MNGDIAAKVNAVFTMYDANKNGYLELQEFKNIVKTGVHDVTDVQAKKMLSALDKDFDGKLSWNEVYQAMVKNGGH